MDLVDVEENFYGVYLLKSLNPRFKGATYIGFTVDPNRRIKQHNRGKAFGGAWRTSLRGPWEMVLTVHGFPSDVSALRFEWAWQHPKKSRRLKSLVTNKKSTESSLNYNIKIMFIMLSTPPWNRLPLILRWLSVDAVIDAPPNLEPPAHMPVTYGSVISKKIKKTKKTGTVDGNISSEATGPIHCQICGNAGEKEDFLMCINSNCKGNWHMFCIADKFVSDELANSKTEASEMLGKQNRHIIPVEGSCPECESYILWGDLIKRKIGCYQSLQKDNSQSHDSDS